MDIDKLYDAVIIGGGPAGLTAALYLARARYRVLVVEKDRFGGQITITDEVVNYPGVYSVSGSELTQTMRRQAEAFGAEFMLAEVTGFDLAGDVKRVKTTKGDIPCFAALLATGASPRSVGFAGEEEFLGHGVAYCATCDGEFFTGKDVFVIGGGFAAAEESVFLTKYARRVTVLVREDDFTCAPAVAEEAKRNEKITVLYSTEAVEATGDSSLRTLRYRNVKTGEEGLYRAADGDTFGIFVFVGYAPATQLVQGIAELDSHGYVLTDERQMTSADGLFAAGDVCVKGLRQVATAVGQAAQAATDMERYLKAAQERTGLVPAAPAGRPAAGGADSTGAFVAAPGAGTAAPQAPAGGPSSLFDDAMLAQLNTVFSRMERSLVLRLHVDESDLSSELCAYMDELCGLTHKLSLVTAEVAPEGEGLPYVEVCDADGAALGLAFHGVPGGHEFTSFVLGLYNAAGPGQPIADDDAARIAGIADKVSIKVLVSLSCTMCPETVVSAQRIAADSPQVVAHVYDVAHFPRLRERYNAMSVPCVVVERAGVEVVSFGKKNLSQMLDLLG